MRTARQSVLVLGTLLLLAGCQSAPPNYDAPRRCSDPGSTCEFGMFGGR